MLYSAALRGVSHVPDHTAGLPALPVRKIITVLLYLIYMITVNILDFM